MHGFLPLAQRGGQQKSIESEEEKSAPLLLCVKERTPVASGPDWPDDAGSQLPGNHPAVHEGPAAEKQLLMKLEGRVECAAEIPSHPHPFPYASHVAEGTATHTHTYTAPPSGGQSQVLECNHAFRHQP